MGLLCYFDEVIELFQLGQNSSTFWTFVLPSNPTLSRDTCLAEDADETSAAMMLGTLLTTTFPHPTPSPPYTPNPPYAPNPPYTPNPFKPPYAQNPLPWILSNHSTLYLTLLSIDESTHRR